MKKELENFILCNLSDDLKAFTNAYAIILLESGKLNLKWNGADEYIDFPALICLNHKQIFYFYPQKCNGLILYFAPEFINKNLTLSSLESDAKQQFLSDNDVYLLAPFLNHRFNDSLIPLTNGKIQYIKNLFSSMEEQLLVQKDWYFSCRARSYFIDCLHIIEHYYYSRIEQIPEPSFHFLHFQTMNKQVEEALNMIHKQYSDSSFNASTIIKLVCSYIKKLIQLYLENTSKSIYQYLLDYRIYNAQQRLKLTKLNITEIAYSCGFNDICSFSTTFKKKTGQTPSEFRNFFINKRKNTKKIKKK